MSSPIKYSKPKEKYPSVVDVKLLKGYNNLKNIENKESI